MLDKLLGLISKATSIQPSYRPDHCLAVTRQTGGCDVCAEICPHQAISIKRQVEIDDIDCTGCGLCVQSCPSQALEARVSYQTGAPLKCSQVNGSAQSVQCLARLESSDLLHLAGKRPAVTIAHGDCASCPIGGAAVPDAVEALAAEARSLADFLGRELEVRILIVERLDQTDNPDSVSRRDLFKGGWRSLQHTASEALAPLDPGGKDEGSLPRELQRRYRLIERSEPEPEAAVPWVLPQVAEGCIMCPVCTSVCPTDAFHREFDSPDAGDGATLKFKPERCNGCGACLKSCPVGVIGFEEGVSWAQLSGGEVDAYRRPSGQGAAQSIARIPGKPESDASRSSASSPATSKTGGADDEIVASEAKKE